jgi:hypothetical protein
MSRQPAPDLTGTDLALTAGLDGKARPLGSKAAACTAFGAAGTSFLIIVVLHFLKPDLDPSWRFLSEYSVGDHGWLMQLAFLLMSLSYGALAVALRPHMEGRVASVGLFFLWLAALGTVLAGLFNMDLITIVPPEPTFHGSLHGLGAMLGVPSLPIAALLLSVGLARKPGWNAARGRLLLSANLTWVTFAFMNAVVLASLSGGGQFGPDVLVGWPNRLLIVTHFAWTMIMAARAAGLIEAHSRASN